MSMFFSLLLLLLLIPPSLSNPLASLLNKNKLKYPPLLNATTFYPTPVGSHVLLVESGRFVTLRPAPRLSKATANALALFRLKSYPEYVLKTYIEVGQGATGGGTADANVDRLDGADLLALSLIGEILYTDEVPLVEEQGALLAKEQVEEGRVEEAGEAGETWWSQPHWHLSEAVVATHTLTTIAAAVRGSTLDFLWWPERTRTLADLTSGGERNRAAERARIAWNDAQLDALRAGVDPTTVASPTDRQLVQAHDHLELFLGGWQGDSVALASSAAQVAGWLRLPLSLSLAPPPAGTSCLHVHRALASPSTLAAVANSLTDLLSLGARAAPQLPPSLVSSMPASAFYPLPTALTARSISLALEGKVKLVSPKNFNEFIQGGEMLLLFWTRSESVVEAAGRQRAAEAQWQADRAATASQSNARGDSKSQAVPAVSVYPSAGEHDVLLARRLALEGLDGARPLVTEATPAAAAQAARFGVDSFPALVLLDMRALLHWRYEEQPYSALRPTLSNATALRRWVASAADGTLPPTMRDAPVQPTDLTSVPVRLTWSSFQTFVPLNGMATPRVHRNVLVCFCDSRKGDECRRDAQASTPLGQVAAHFDRYPLETTDSQYGQGAPVTVAYLDVGTNDIPRHSIDSQIRRTPTYKLFTAWDTTPFVVYGLNPTADDLIDYVTEALVRGKGERRFRQAPSEERRATRRN